MEDASIVIAFWVETLLWISIVLGVLVARRWWTWARVFSGAMIRQWRPALVIAVLCVVCRALAGEGVTLDGPVVFCQALIGLALARSIVGYEPLPVTQAVVRREGAWRRVGMMLAVALALVPLPIVVSVLGGLGGHLLGETPLTGSSVANSFPPESWKVFLMMLAGAGIAEETPYRLVLLSLIWRWARRPWLAIALSAVLFGIYHLTPLNLFYGTYWQAPITQFLIPTLGGMVMGYVYVKRGYETAVLGHTLGDTVIFSLMAAR